MLDEAHRLPHVPEELRAFAVWLLAEVKAQALLIEKLRHQLAGHRAHRSGASSETAEQLQLALETSEIKLRLPDVEKDKPRRRPIPGHIPRQQVELTPGGDRCAECGGRLPRVGEDVTEEPEYVPGRFVVNRIVRPHLACSSCERFTQAPLPSRPIERGRPGPGLLAQVLVSKYADHLPLHRQSRSSSATASTWILHPGGLGRQVSRSAGTPGRHHRAACAGRRGDLRRRHARGDARPRHRTDPDRASGSRDPAHCPAPRHVRQVSPCRGDPLRPGPVAPTSARSGARHPRARQQRAVKGERRAEHARHRLEPEELPVRGLGGRRPRRHRLIAYTPIDTAKLNGVDPKPGSPTPWRASPIIPSTAWPNCCLGACAHVKARTAQARPLPVGSDPEHGDEVMLLSKFDGFLAGIAVCLELIMPGEWLHEIWGEEGPVFTSERQANEIPGLIMDHDSDVLRRLNTPGRYAPLLGTDRDGSTLWEMWASGFGSAVALRPEAWADFTLSGRPAVHRAMAFFRRLDELANQPGNQFIEMDNALDAGAPELIPEHLEVLHAAGLARLSPIQSNQAPD